MKKRIYSLLFSGAMSLQLFGQAPDFSIAGFATENGGTTGGEGGTVVTATNYADLKRYAETKDTKYVIKVSGTITGSGNVADGSYSGSIRVASNKTIVGASNNTLLNGVGFSITGSKNIIIQNLIFTMTGIKIPAGSGDIAGIYSKLGDEGRAQILVNSGDCISIYGTSTRNIWIDHCEFYNEDPTKQTNQDLYDGLIDVKNDAAYITISWCYFHDHHKSGLTGSSDDAKENIDRKMTFHHNYWKNIGARMPLYRFGTGHVFNNFVLGGASGNTGSGINSRMGACLLIENNHFEDKRDPIVSKDSKLDGYWNVKNNKFVNCTGNQPTTSNCTFTPSYNYANVFTENVEDVKSLVVAYAGVGKTITSFSKPVVSESASGLSLHPNPAKDQTTVTFFLQQTAAVSITLSDPMGTTIKPVAESNYSPGRHALHVNTSDLKSGVYIVSLNVNGKIISQKLVVN